MRFDSDLVNSLDTHAAARYVTQRPLMQMPPLISDRALAESVEVLGKSAAAIAQSGEKVATETIGMPKRGLGPRAITLLPPAVRTLYDALVNSISAYAPVPSRSRDWSEHQRFGLDRFSEDLLLDFDIAACYEYIDHGILFQELVSGTLDPIRSSAIVGLLGEIFDRSRGLPQGLDASHMLSDFYLSRLDRALLHSGLVADRYADDFRVSVKDWADAHDTLELISDITRRMGLVLADSKTVIWNQHDAWAHVSERERLLDEYKVQVQDELTSISLVDVGYGEWEEVEQAPAPADVDEGALLRVVELWATGDPANRGAASKLGASALKVLAAGATRVDNAQLTTIAEREPIRLWNVLQYALVRKGESDANWSLIEALSKIARQSPWFKLWLLHVASVQAGPSVSEQDALQTVNRWAESLVNDRHESVRCAAAWYLSGVGLINTNQIVELFRVGTDVSRPGLSAAVGRRLGSGVGGGGKIEGSIRTWDPLTRAAFDWGRQTE